MSQLLLFLLCTKSNKQVLEDHHDGSCQNKIVGVFFPSKVLKQHVTSELFFPPLNFKPEKQDLLTLVNVLPLACETNYLVL